MCKKDANPNEKSSYTKSEEKNKFCRVFEAAREQETSNRLSQVVFFQIINCPHPQPHHDSHPQPHSSTYFLILIMIARSYQTATGWSRKSNNVETLLQLQSPGRGVTTSIVIVKVSKHIFSQIEQLVQQRL